MPAVFDLHANTLSKILGSVNLVLFAPAPFGMLTFRLADDEEKDRQNEEPWKESHKRIGVRNGMRAGIDRIGHEREHVHEDNAPSLPGYRGPTIAVSLCAKPEFLFVYINHHRVRSAVTTNARS